MVLTGPGHPQNTEGDWIETWPERVDQATLDRSIANAAIPPAYRTMVVTTTDDDGTSRTQTRQAPAGRLFE